MQLRSAVLHKLYNEHIFRKLIQKTQLRHNMKRGKLTIFVNWKKTFWTNKLEYCVLESERTLRVLHLMFAHADSPDRMSNLAQGTRLVASMPPTRGEQHH